MKNIITLAAVTAAALSIMSPSSVASAQVVVEYPTPEVIATLTPVYYEGHAAYWWHNHWHYRDAHGHWAHYEAEPQVLHDHRFNHQFDRHYYAGGYHRR